MGVNNNYPDDRDDGPARDPRLVRLLQAAGGEEPPTALDAAILAAARREVGARPQIVGVGSAAEAPQAVVRGKRNWYVPVSIAAVLVMSASLVMVVHEEKTDEIAQPPRQVGQVDVPAKPAAPPAPVSAPAPAAEAPGPVPSVSNDKRDELRDATPAPAQPKLAEKTTVGGQVASAPAPGRLAELSKKQRVERLEKAEPAADSTRTDKAATAGAREPEAMGSVGAAPATPAVATAPPVAPAVVVPSPAQAKPPAEPFPAQANRDAVQARARSEADQAGSVRDSAPPAPLTVPPAAMNAPPAAAASAPRRAAPAAEVAAPDMAERRAPPVVRPPPPPPPAPMAIRPGNSETLRVLALRGLEDQPPEKWLERAAEFKRDSRWAEWQFLMIEFGRRFPDHPAIVPRP